MRARFMPAFLLAALFAGCKSVEAPKLPGVTPYRMVIQQGNFISDEMIAQLKPGMTKEQVRFVLGTPLVTDIFHADRWDYVFFRELPNGKREQRNLSVVFQDSKLVRVIGDLLPEPGAKPPAVAKPAAPEPKPAAEAKAAAEPAKPAPPKAAAESWEPTRQNWGSAPAGPAKPAAAAEPKEEDKKPAAEEKQERGFFGRLIDRIAPGTAEAKPEQKPEPQVEAPKPAAEVKQEEKKPAEEKKERGFFGRMLEKIGL